MLVIRLSYTASKGIFPVLSGYGFHFYNELYVKTLASEKEEVRIIHDNASLTLTMTCTDGISFGACLEIHDLLTDIAGDLSAVIDDSGAMLGYNSEGKTAYLYHGFHEWRTYINKAKQRSMEGITVEISDRKKTLGRGMLVQSDVSAANLGGKPQTPSFTIISSEGEVTFFGENLVAHPASETVKRGR